MENINLNHYAPSLFKLYRFYFMRLLILLLFIHMSLYSQPLDVDVSAESALLMNAETGVILFEKNSQQPLHPASITKIATAAYVLNCTQCSLDEVITAKQDAIGSVTEDAKRRSNYTLPSHWLVVGASHMGIKRGEELSLKDLLYGMMLASADDASNVIAQHVGGTIPEFMDALNTYMVSIGCKNTYFNNPHGLYHPKHQTTAYDMALLTSHALKNPIFREIVSTVRYTRPKTNKQEASVFVQTNRLLVKGKHYYPKAVGVKTGYIAAAQNTLVAAAKSDDRLLIAVLMKVKERPIIFNEAVRLFEAAFEEEKIKDVVIAEGEQTVELDLIGGKKPIKTYAKESLVLEYYPAEEPLYKLMLVWDEVSLPVYRHARVGEIQLQTQQGDVLRVIELFAQETVKSTWPHWFRQWFE